MMRPFFFRHGLHGFHGLDDYNSSVLSAEFLERSEKSVPKSLYLLGEHKSKLSAVKP